MAIHADLGRAEWATTPETVQRIAAEAGMPLTVVRRAAGDLVDRWIQRFESGKRRYAALETYNLIGPWSSASLRFCQSEMKAAVIGPAVARMHQGEQIISVLGLRRDESHNRASIPIAKADERYAKAGNRHGTTMMTWHPIADWTSSDVFHAHRMLGILLHEAYSTWGSSRLSCRYCIFASLKDLEVSAAAPSNAEVYRELVGIEARSTFPFQPTRWLGVETAAKLIQRCAPSALPFGFEWASDCDRLRAGEFGGGYVAITADTIEYGHTSLMLDRAIARASDEGADGFVLATRNGEPGLSFWNNEDGFGSLARATVFSETEAAKFDLPIADDQPEWLAMPAPLRL